MNEPFAEALLASEHSTITNNADGTTTVTFTWPGIARDARPWQVRYEENKAATAASPAWVEHHNLGGNRPTIYRTTKTLTGSTVKSGIAVIDRRQHSNDETGIETYTYVIGTRWSVVTLDGKFIRGDRYGSCFYETEKDATKAQTKWTKAAAEEDWNQDFIDEHLDDIERLAGRTSPVTLPGPDTKVGDIVAITGHGRTRLGIVADVSKTRVKVAWTTPAAVKNGASPLINWHRHARPGDATFEAAAKANA